MLEADRTLQFILRSAIAVKVESFEVRFDLRVAAAEPVGCASDISRGRTLPEIVQPSRLAAETYANRPDPNSKNREDITNDGPIIGATRCQPAARRNINQHRHKLREQLQFRQLGDPSTTLF